MKQPWAQGFCGLYILIRLWYNNHDSSQPINKMKKIYLVDSENVGDVWVPLLVSSQPEDMVLVFYTQKSPHMNYENVRMLKETEKEAVFIKCFEGSNALDFQLVTELGYRLREDADSEYVIVSNDTGFDAAVRYWTARRQPVSRLSGKECYRQLTNKKRRDPKKDEPSAQTETDAADQTDRAGGRENGKPGRQVVTLVPGDPDTEVELVPITVEEAVRLASVPPEAEPERDFGQPEPASGQAEIVSADEAADGLSVELADTSEADTAKEPAVESSEIVPADEAADTQTVRRTRTSGRSRNRKAKANDAEIRPVTAPEAKAAKAAGEDETGLPVKEPESGTDQSVAETGDAGSEADSQNGTGTGPEPGSRTETGSQTKDGADGSQPESDSSAEVKAGEETGEAEQPEAEEDRPEAESSVTAAETAGADLPAPKTKKDVTEKLFCCISRENLVDFHNALVAFLGEEEGKELYQEIKGSTECTACWNASLKESQKERFEIYCQLVFSHSEYSEEAPEDFAEFLYQSNGKRKNLNSLRAALQSRYGKDKGMKYYSLFRPHIKIMNRM